MKPIAVVLVDENKVFRDALATWLQQFDRVRVSGCAQGAEEGLRLVRAGKPDLVVMNMFLPGVSGIDASRRIARNGGLPKVVLMSGVEDYGLPQLARAAMADAFIPKRELYSRLASSIEDWFGAAEDERTECVRAHP